MQEYETLPKFHQRFIKKYCEAKIMFDMHSKDLIKHENQLREINKAQKTGIISKELLQTLIDSYKGTMSMLLSLTSNSRNMYINEMNEAEKELIKRGYDIKEIEDNYMSKFKF